MKILIFSLVFQSIYSLHPVSAIRPVNIRYIQCSFQKGRGNYLISLLTDVDQKDKVAKHKL